MKVSVIVPVYNCAPYLSECIASLREQTMEEIELIFVDDASTDGSLALLRRAHLSPILTMLLCGAVSLLLGVAMG